MITKAFIAGVIQILGLQCEHGNCVCPQIRHTVEITLPSDKRTGEEFSAGFQWAMERKFDDVACVWIVDRAKVFGFNTGEEK